MDENDKDYVEPMGAETNENKSSRHFYGVEKRVWAFFDYFDRLDEIAYCSGDDASEHFCESERLLFREDITENKKMTPEIIGKLKAGEKLTHEEFETVGRVLGQATEAENDARHLIQDVRDGEAFFNMKTLAKELRDRLATGEHNEDRQLIEICLSEAEYNLESGCEEICESHFCGFVGARVLTGLRFDVGAW